MLNQLLLNRLGYVCAFFAALYDHDKDNLHAYWEEYFKIFDIIMTEVSNSSLLLSKLYFLFATYFCELPGPIFYFIVSKLTPLGGWFIAE